MSNSEDSSAAGSLVTSVGEWTESEWFVQQPFLPYIHLRHIQARGFAPVVAAVRGSIAET